MTLRALSIVALPLTLTLALAACGEADTTPPQAAAPFDAALYQEGRMAFQRGCAGCHGLERDQEMIGPHLAELNGRKAGSVRGYDYSQALSGSDIVWTAETLDTFLANVRGTVPGTKMVIADLQDPAEREAIIYFLFEDPR